MSETKECPYCAETIKAAAIKCKHCKSMIDQNGVPFKQSDGLSQEMYSQRNQIARKLLLSEFINIEKGRNHDIYYKNNRWKSILSEEPEKVIKEFMDEGLLEPLDLHNLVSNKFKTSDLKDMLKKVNLKSTGKKDDLIQRLIEYDIKMMSELVIDLNIYRCTKAGLSIVEKFIAEEEAIKEAAEREAYEFLINKEYSKAIEVKKQYKEPREYRHEETRSNDRSIPVISDQSRLIKSLERMSKSTPPILRELSKEKLDELRKAAVFDLFWGSVPKWLSNNLDTGTHLNVNTVCRMFSFHDSFLNSKEVIKSSPFKMKTRILTVNDEQTCPACREISGWEYYNIDEVPELPYAKCSAKNGCRCNVIIDTVSR